MSVLTSQDLLAYFERVKDGSSDASHSANHASQTQVDQHEKEHH